MENLRKYGTPPFSVAVIHGGPGAPGEMAPLARELASGWGVLEPLQTAASLDGQIEELKTVLQKDGDLPMTLIGFSWGAWLSYLVAAKYPALVKKLILIGSGSYEERYVAGIQEIRLKRLSEEDKAEVQSLMEVLDNPAIEDKRTAFARFGELFSKADAYDPIPDEADVVDFQADVYQSVWTEAAELRRSGLLSEFAKQIHCPVVAIHGDYDPHLAEGVQKPLSAVLTDFRFILLKDCGHKPWIERQAREVFLDIVRDELR